MNSREIVFDLRGSDGLCIMTKLPLDGMSHTLMIEMVGTPDGIEILFPDEAQVVDEYGKPIDRVDGAYATWEELDAIAIERLTEET